ncbi:hypothetical protein [Rhodococcus sp. JVH1]|uniref:hypothetical protein n=1 Tax=Rhodococcus sp. JVH1 TaxID=745408 RepID=UPI000271EF4D|nr:hypothetical protein [Rhodococcus sp. JVH1]EJI98512.1 hypothetical protein JVH1_3933 [Rhodococcus sp. JVH1]
MPRLTPLDDDKPRSSPSGRGAMTGSGRLEALVAGVGEITHGAGEECARLIGPAGGGQRQRDRGALG